jgi:C_GCAxxG_C_C family probable redox protein
MLCELITDWYDNRKEIVCSERIVFAANAVLKLGLSEKALRLSSGFGLGMGIESICGALIGCVMILGYFFPEHQTHEESLKGKRSRIELLAKEFLTQYESNMGSLLCSELRKNYANEEKSCRVIVLKAAEILEHILFRELDA